MGIARYSGAAVALALLASCIRRPDDFDAPWPSPQVGMVVAEHPIATEAGLAILDAGGNAADAAVATALALAVVYPKAGNLGGGGFALWVPHEETDENPARAYDFRETAPRSLGVEQFRRGGEIDQQLAVRGGLAVGVPGSPAGLHLLHSKHGRLSLEEVAEPAWLLARDGFPVDAWLAKDLREPKYRELMEESFAAYRLFYPNDEPLSEGDILRQPGLATTIKRWVAEGPSGFYDGTVAQLIVDQVERTGGVMSRKDLLDYAPIVREPLRGWFRGREILTMPLPSSGGIVLLQTLAVLDGFPLDQERRNTLAEWNAGEEAADPSGVSPRAVHWWIEAMRASFADRAMYLGDPAFVPDHTESLLAPRRTLRQRTGIGVRSTPDVDAAPLSWRPESTETTHLSVLDDEGNAVSLTTTLNGAYGNGAMVPDAGFFLNNEIDDFALGETSNQFGLVGAKPNQIQGGKRPLSSMTPTVLRTGGNVVTMVIGSPGGPRIISSVLQVILRTVVYGQELEAAIRAPRVHQQWVPSETYLEPGWEQELVRELGYLDHEFLRGDKPWASVQAIEVSIGGVPVGFSDARRGGAAGAQGQPIAEPAQPQ